MLGRKTPFFIFRLKPLLIFGLILFLFGVFVNQLIAQTPIADPSGTVYTPSCASGTGALGYALGQTYTISNSGSWPSCLAWGLPTGSGIPAINGSILASSACTYNNVTYNAAAPTDLLNGIAAFKIGRAHV